jgi:glycerate dehydrogenase
MPHDPDPSGPTRHQIVVLDGFTLNPGDLSWERLLAHGTLSVHDRSPAESVVEHARGADIVITNKVVLDAPRIAQLPALRYIGVSATGTNIVDGAAARRQGIVVTNVPDYGAGSVAEHAFALILEAYKQVRAHTLAVAAGGWVRTQDFSFTVAPLAELGGKTLGIVGFGAIGRRVAEIAAAFRMQVLVAEHSPKRARTQARSADHGTDLSVEPCSLDALFARADVISLHCPLTPETRGLVDARRLALMKPSALLVNTARGGLVVEAALADALTRGTIRGACLDVLGSEPPEPSNPLLACPNCWITPHVAWASFESRRRLLDATLGNVEAFIQGRPMNVVN